ncbi:hypothetical protein Trydic_g14792 [Trypoxylus dichotomus]
MATERWYHPPCPVATINKVLTFAQRSSQDESLTHTDTHTDASQSSVLLHLASPPYAIRRCSDISHSKQFNLIRVILARLVIVGGYRPMRFPSYVRTARLTVLGSK